MPAISQKIGLDYDTFMGDFKIWKGKASTNNFKLEGPQMNFAASAETNLVTGELDGEVNVTPKQLLNKVVKTSPLIGKIFENELKGTLTENHFTLGGTLEKPKLSLK